MLGTNSSIKHIFPPCTVVTSGLPSRTSGLFLVHALLLAYYAPPLHPCRVGGIAPVTSELVLVTSHCTKDANPYNDREWITFVSELPRRRCYRIIDWTLCHCNFSAYIVASCERPAILVTWQRCHQTNCRRQMTHMRWMFAIEHLHVNNRLFSATFIDSSLYVQP